MRFLRTNTAIRLTVGPFFDQADGVTPETSLTVTSCKLTLMVDTANVPTLILDTAPTASGGNNDMVHVTGDDAGFYDLELTAANLNYLGRAMLAITDAANHCPVFHEFMIIPAMIYDALILGTDRLDTNVTHMNDVAASAVTTIKAVQGLATDGVVPTVTTVTNQLTAAQIATGVWQDATAGDFTTASSIGKALYVANVVPGAAGGHFIAGTNAATTITTGLTTTFTGNLTGSVGSVSGAVGSVTAAVLVSAGTGSGQLDFTSGRIKADTVYWNAAAVATPTVAGVPEVDTTYYAGLIQTQKDLGDEIENVRLAQSVEAIKTTDILSDTAEIGVAGAGLTNINLPNQTMDIVGNITGNLSGSVGSVTGNVGGNVTGSVGSISGVTFPTNFAALGINASGHISRVVLVDTLTTYTGNTPQTGDSYAKVDTEIAAIITTLGTPADVSLAQDLVAIAAYVDSLESRLTATRAGYLDNLSVGAVAQASALDSLVTTVGVAGAGLTAVSLAATGLDSISTTAPSGVASNFREMLVQTWRRFFKKTVRDATTIKTYADNGSTVLTTQSYTSVDPDDNVGAAS